MFPGINPNLAAMSIRPTMPDRPIISTIIYTATQATVVVSPPNFNGGAIINSVRVVRSPGSVLQNISGPAGGTTIYTGLTPNTNYTFTAYAINEIGTSTTASSIIKTLTDVSMAPTELVATATSSTRAAIQYTQPASNNGAVITSYTAISTPGSITASTITALSSVIYIYGLVTATDYTFQIYATNSNGNSPVSTSSNQIKTFAIVPDSPIIGTGTYIGNRTIRVAYTAPAYNGGSTITSYTAISTPGNISATTSTAGSGIINVPGLSALTSYTFKVHATNSIGTSSQSAASSLVSVPSTPPLAPSITSVSLTTSSSVTITYTAPADNGGSTILSYTAISSPGSITTSTSRAGGGTIFMSGLSFNTSYTFQVLATNAVGAGPYSTTSSYVATWGSIIYETGARSDLPTMYSWVAPKGVTSVSVVAVGAGGGLWASVSPVPTAANASSWFSTSTLVMGGGVGDRLGAYYRPGGTYTGDGGGAGGRGGIWPGYRANNPAGGGAGGYSGAGGAGACGSASGSCGSNAALNSGGGGGGGNAYSGTGAACWVDGGGGVGLYGRGADGAYRGGGGSGGGNSSSAATYYSCGGKYGGGGGAANLSGSLGGGGGGLGWKNSITVVPDQTYTVQAGAQGVCGTLNKGAKGAVRIVWPALNPAGNRLFPITNVSTP